MKFNIIFANFYNNSGEGERIEREVEGDLDTVKTYVKLTAGDNFSWGAVSRLDELSPGDVDKWMIQKNRTTRELSLTPFSFYRVDTEININAMRAVFNDRIQLKVLHKKLGGGKI